MRFATEVDINPNPKRFDDMRNHVDTLLLETSYRLMLLEIKQIKKSYVAIMIRQINQIAVNRRIR